MNHHLLPHCLIGQPPVTKAGLSAVQLAEADPADAPALKLSVVILPPCLWLLHFLID